MDDLSGLDWSATSAANNKHTAKPTIAASSSAFSSGGFSSYPSLRPTPSPLASGRNTPLSSQGSGAMGAAAPKPSLAAVAKPAQDSFSGLINFGSAKNTVNMSLRERQELLEAEKRKKEAERQKQHEAQYGNGGQFLDALARGSAGASRVESPAIAISKPANADDDLFAAFNANTKVDNSSYFPPTELQGSGKSTPAPTPAPPPGLDLSNPSAWHTTAPSNTTADDDDDPFGLNQLKSKSNASAAPPAAPTQNDNDDDDLLGDLARPVEEFRRKAEEQKRQQQQQQKQEQEQERQRRQARPEPGKPIEDSDSSSDTGGGARARKTGNEALDKAIAQLMDYGFTAENAKRGLAESGAGLNVQAAVNWLLDDAHRQAKEKAKAKHGGGGGADPSQMAEHDRPSPSGSRGRHTGPAWMRDDAGTGAQRTDSRSPGALVGDDFAKTAAAMGTNFLKTANSLWKTGQKRMQQAVQEFQHEVDPSQPRWMRSGPHENLDDERDQRRAAAAAKTASNTATDEALMLESGACPERRHHQQSRPMPALEPRFRQENNNSRASSRTQSPPGTLGASSNRNSPVPRWQQQQQQQQKSTVDPRARLTKQAIEAESAQVYVSPARRRKAAPPPSQANPSGSSEAQPKHPPEGDLLSNSTALPQRPAQPKSIPASSSARPSAQSSPSPRPAAVRRPARQVPAVNSLVLQASAQQRAAGATHFKRGDYAAAHVAYSASLTGLPATHPLLAVLFCNRALTALKTGEPRQAVADADAALNIIGSDKGEGESVALEDGTGQTRDMKELYGKALARKAEALEQMEKWAEAGTVWQQCVEGGVGGATAIAGRQRCQKALQPKPQVKPQARPQAKPAAARPPARTQVQKDSEAVQRLRAANEAAEKEDSDKLALTDKVDARVASWRDGKKDNLRALLGSMELVLWEGSGWKKVGLHELVMPNKVKIAYMRAIGKTHPDKLPQDASTEIRMIAGMVFSTLNESWDKFKADNKM